MNERECCGTLAGSRHRITCPKSQHHNALKVSFRYRVRWTCGIQYDENWYTRWSEASAKLLQCLQAGYHVEVKAETDITPRRR